MLQSILRFQDGVHLQVGRNEKNLFCFVPMLFYFAVDTMEANALCGINGSPGANMRCRLCKSSRENLHGNTISIRRNSEELDTLSREGNRAFFEKINIPKHGRYPDEIKNILQQVNLQSVLCVENPLHKYFNWTEKKHHIGIPHCFPFDALHTLLKGLVEYVSKWTYIIICSVGGRDRVHYVNNVSDMDYKLKSFSVNHSVTPFGVHRFRKGISGQFSNVLRKEKDNEMSGSR